MQIRLGKSNSSLYQRSVRFIKEEQRHYFEQLRRKTVDGGQRPPAKAVRNAARTA